MHRGLIFPQPRVTPRLQLAFVDRFGTFRRGNRCLSHACRQPRGRSSHYVYVHFFLVFVASWLRPFAAAFWSICMWVGWVIRRHTCTRQQLQALPAVYGSTSPLGSFDAYILPQGSALGLVKTAESGILHQDTLGHLSAPVCASIPNIASVPAQAPSVQLLLLVLYVLVGDTTTVSTLALPPRFGDGYDIAASTRANGRILITTSEGIPRRAGERNGCHPASDRPL